MLRFLIALFVLRVKPSFDISDTIEKSYRVKPWDLDMNIHLNNAKYLKYLDKGRVEHIIYSRTLRRMLKHNMKLIVANSEISYIRSLLPFQKFTVSSRITCWDKKYVYYEQSFTSKGQLYATAVIRLALLKGDKTTSPIAAFNQLSSGLASPEIPMSVTLLNRLIRAQRIESAKEDKNTQATTDRSTDKVLLTTES